MLRFSVAVVVTYFIVIPIFWLMFRSALRTRTWQDQVRIVLIWPWVVGVVAVERYKRR